MPDSVTIYGDAAMQAVGRRLARLVRDPDYSLGVVFLRGELGAGKTTLVKGLVAGMMKAGEKTPVVTSPTFTLVEQYDIDTGTLFHLDLYRLDSPLELEAIGMRDMLVPGNLVVIEWPDRASDLLPPADLTLTIGFSAGEAGDCRTIIADPALDLGSDIDG